MNSPESASSSDNKKWSLKRILKIIVIWLISSVLLAALSAILSDTIKGYIVRVIGDKFERVWYSRERTAYFLADRNLVIADAISGRFSDKDYVRQLYLQAEEDLKEAIKGGYAPAMYAYGRLLCIGRGQFITMNRAQGRQLIAQAIDSGLSSKAESTVASCDPR